MKITNETGKEITLDMVHGRSALPCEIVECYLNGKYFDQDDFGQSYDKGGYCDSEDLWIMGV